MRRIYNFISMQQEDCDQQTSVYDFIIYNSLILMHIEWNRNKKLCKWPHQTGFLSLSKYLVAHICGLLLDTFAFSLNQIKLQAFRIWTFFSFILTPQVYFVSFFCTSMMNSSFGHWRNYNEFSRKQNSIKYLKMRIFYGTIENLVFWKPNYDYIERWTW